MPASEFRFNGYGFVDPAHAFSAVGCDIDGMARLLQSVADARGDLGFIFGYEDTHD